MRCVKGGIGYTFSVDFCRPGDSYREALLDLSALDQYENTHASYSSAIDPQMNSKAGIFSRR